ncbi:hypothetical protein GPALN_013179 [Globodera pallida]|nr:hypothetical protein GPALN_013179 [Globodera pallida]
MHYLLYQRKCQALFGIDPIPETYQNVTLTIEHNCIEENKIVIPLGDIGPNQFKDNRAELNGLYIILNKNFGVREAGALQIEFLGLDLIRSGMVQCVGDL